VEGTPSSPSVWQAATTLSARASASARPSCGTRGAARVAARRAGRGAGAARGGRAASAAAGGPGGGSGGGAGAAVALPRRRRVGRLAIAHHTMPSSARIGSFRNSMSTGTSTHGGDPTPVPPRCHAGLYRDRHDQPRRALPTGGRHLGGQPGDGAAGRRRAGAADAGGPSAGGRRVAQHSGIARIRGGGCTGRSTSRPASCSATGRRRGRRRTSSARCTRGSGASPTTAPPTTRATPTCSCGVGDAGRHLGPRLHALRPPARGRGPRSLLHRAAALRPRGRHSRGPLPAGHAGLRAYVEEMVARELRVTDVGRDVARATLHPPLPGRCARGVARGELLALLTVGLLPEPLRRDYGWVGPGAGRPPARLDRGGAPPDPLLPGLVREFPAARRAARRERAATGRTRVAASAGAPRRSTNVVIRWRSATRSVISSARRRWTRSVPTPPR